MPIEEDVDDIAEVDEVQSGDDSDDEYNDIDFHAAVGSCPLAYGRSSRRVMNEGQKRVAA